LVARWGFSTKSSGFKGGTLVPINSIAMVPTLPFAVRTVNIEEILWREDYVGGVALMRPVFSPIGMFYKERDLLLPRANKKWELRGKPSIPPAPIRMLVEEETPANMSSDVNLDPPIKRDDEFPYYFGVDEPS
jgi:hypothetical protein